MFGAIEAIKDKITKRLEIGDIVADGIDSGEEDNSVTLISSSVESSSEPKSNQSTVSPARSSSAPRGHQSSQPTVSPAKSSSESGGNGSPGLRAKAVRGARQLFSKGSKGQRKKGPEEPVVLSENLTPMRSLRSAKTITIEDIQIALGTAIKNRRVDLIVNRIGNNFELVNNAVNSKDTVTIELLKEAIDLISRDDRSTIFHLIAHKGDKAKILELFLELDSVKVIESIDTVTNKAGKTAYEMAKGKKENKTFIGIVDNARKKKKVSIEEIRLELERFIKSESSGDILNLISDNHETIKKSIEKSGDTDFMGLILHAAHFVKDAEIEKTAYEMAKEQNNLIFQEVVKNASDKLVELRKKDESYLTLTYRIESNYDGHGTSIDDANAKPQSQHTILQSAAPRDYENMKRWTTSPNLTNGKKSELNNSLSQSAPSVTHKSCENFEEACSEFDRNFYLTNLQNAIRDKKVDRIISIITENIDLIHSILNSDDQVIKQLHIDNLYKAIKITDLDLCKNLSEQAVKVLKLFNSLKNIMPSALEATDEEGETPLDIAGPIGGKNTRLVWSGENDLQSSIDRDDLKLILINGVTQAVPLALPQPFTKLYNPDDSGYSEMSSPVSSPKKEGMESSQSSRRNSLLSNTGSDTEEEEIEPELQEEFPPAEKPLPLLNKGRPKGPSGRRTPSKPLVKPALVVAPVLGTGIQKEQKQIEASATRVTLPPQEGEPAPDAAKAPDRVTKEPKVIKPEEEKENTLRVKRKPAANRNSDKDISLKKQSNNRSFCFAATTISTLGAIACFATASIYIMSAKKANPVFSTSSIAVIGALFLIGIGFAATAGITWCLTPPPPLSELTSTDSTRQAAKSRE